MKRQELLDLLVAHADALNRRHRDAGFDLNAWLKAYPLAVEPCPSSLLELLNLAQSVQQALTPVRPSADFRFTIQRQLSQLPTPEAAPASRRGLWLGAAVIGSTLSIAGLLLLLLHRFRSMPPVPPVQTAASP